MLRQYDWVEANGDWKGPEVGMHVDKSQRGDEVADAIRRNPSSMKDLQGQLQPISMLACQIVIDFPVGWHNATRSSAREAATRRKNMLAYKARCFAAGSQACRSWLNLQHPVACAGWGGGDVLDSDSIVCGLLCGMSKGRAPIQPFAALCMSSQV